MHACLPGWLGAGDWWLGTGLAGGLGLAGGCGRLGLGLGLAEEGVEVWGRLQPSPAVSGRLRPSPAVSSLKGASGFPLTIVNWPFVNCKLSIEFESIVNCQLDSSQLGSKSDPLVFHWQSIGNPLATGNWQLAAWLLGWGLETGGWGLVAGGSWARAWLASGFGLG